MRRCKLQNKKQSVITYGHVVSLLDRPELKNERNDNPRVGLKSLEGSGRLDIRQVPNNMLRIKVRMIHLQDEGKVDIRVSSASRHTIEQANWHPNLPVVRDGSKRSRS